MIIIEKNPNKKMKEKMIKKMFTFLKLWQLMIFKQKTFLKLIWKKIGMLPSQIHLILS
jgi:hypothetical protein